MSTMLQAAFASVGYQPAIEEVEIAQWASRLNMSREFFAAVDYPGRGTADPALTYSAGQLYPPNAANIAFDHRGGMWVSSAAFDYDSKGWLWAWLRLVLSKSTKDVLDIDNSIIDQLADGHREASQSHGVD